MDPDGSIFKKAGQGECRGTSPTDNADSYYTAHHVAGKAATGDDPRFMVATCAPCNLAIGDPLAGDPAPIPHTAWGRRVGDVDTARARTDWDAPRSGGR